MEGEPCVAGLSVESAHPLLRAVFLRRLRLTRLLLEGGAYVNESDELGRTPLMVACGTPHADAQSAGRARLVRYLLERGADPNIQDKVGRSALMHACRQRAGPEVVSSLLAGGADVGLEDRSGTSALVDAVAAGDRRVLALLLDVCKAQGKEVIIIATDKLPCGRLEPGQYLSSLAPPGGRPASAAPCSPSDVKLLASPTSDSQVFCFAAEGREESGPRSPARVLGPGAPGRLLQPLLRLNSEPWLKVAPCESPQRLENPPKEEAQPGPLEPRCLEDDQRRRRGNLMIGGLSKPERRLMDGGESGGEGDYCGKPPGHRIALPGLISCHSASHPDLRSQSLHTPSPFPAAPSPGLRGIVARRRLGADHYSSDPQLAGQTSPRRPPGGQRGPSLWRSPAPLGSRESMEVAGPPGGPFLGMQRRGSEALLLGEDVSPCRPRCLPPLHLHPVAPGNTCGAAGLKTFLPSAPPGHPREGTRRMLSRRHSMQTTA